MSIIVGNYHFEGPYKSMNYREDRSGVYAIQNKVDNNYYLLDVGERSEVKTRVENHDRKDCWKKNCAGILTVSGFYTPNLQQPGRKLIE
jgi:hypothetical protein